MKLFSRFRRPLWEHSEAPRRAEAVRSEQAPELLAALPQIAANDPAPEVRRAAIARIEGAEALLGLLAGERDHGCREAILGRVKARLLNAREEAAERERLCAHPQLPSELLEAVAESAPEVALREAAVLRLNKPGLLQRRCLKDPDAALRLRLLSKIEDEGALERIAEAARGQDKALARAARDKLETLRLARGDAGAIAQRALQLGHSFDALARSLPVDAVDQLAQLQGEMQQLAPALDAALLRRLEGHASSAAAAVAALADAHRPRPEPALSATLTEPSEAVATNSAEHAEASLIAETTEPSAEHADGAVDARPAAAPTATSTATADAPRSDKPQALPDEALREALKEGLAAVEDQRLGIARPALERARERLAAGVHVTPGQRDKLRELEAGVAEMERWQRWAGNKVRARLCDEVEALIGAGLHPDAVANRIKELQEEWAKVEAAEPGSEGASGIARRFRALCQRALAPARPYFEQRRALRGQKAEAIEARCAELEAAIGTAESGEGEADPRALREQVVAALRELDEADPRARAKLGKRLRALLGKLDALREARTQAAIEAKQALLERLRFSIRGDAGQAMTVAKAIQAEWRNAPRADRKTEDRLWAELRGLVDPLFESARAGAQAREKALAEAEAQRRGLLEEAQRLAAEAESGNVEAQLAELEARWQAQQIPAAESADESEGRPARFGRGEREGRGEDGRERRRPRPPHPAKDALEREFDKALARVRAAQQARRETQARQALAALLDAVLEPARADALSEAERRELEAARVQTPVISDLNDALIGLELDAGIDSPAEAGARRRELQMQRLAEHMGSGRIEVDARAGLLAFAPHAMNADAAQKARARRAFEALLG
jgi:DNA repair protein SbcC/Rad50